MSDGGAAGALRRVRHVSAAGERWLASSVGLSDDPSQRALQVGIMALLEVLDEGWVDCAPVCRVAHRELVAALSAPAVRYEPS